MKDPISHIAFKLKLPPSLADHVVLESKLTKDSLRSVCVAVPLEEWAAFEVELRALADEGRAAYEGTLLST